MQNDVTMNIRKASHLGMRLVNINSVPLRINQLALKNAFVRPDALVDQVAPIPPAPLPPSPRSSASGNAVVCHAVP